MHPAFRDVWPDIEAVGGWLTRAQAERLFDEVRALPSGGRVVEIGSHKGRSTAVLASARPDVEVVAIDPFIVGGRWGGPATREQFEANLTRLGVRDRVRHIPRRSQEAKRAWTEPVDLVFIDGKHDYWSTSHDLGWVRFLRPGGRILVHDGFSSVGVTLALLRHGLPATAIRYRGRVGSLVVMDKFAPSRADRLRMVAELPWWVRNLVIKVLLRLRLRPVARAIGHPHRSDPF